MSDLHQVRTRRHVAAPRHVTVIGGGANSEHEVSLASAASVAAGLSAAGFATSSLTIDRSGCWLDHDGHPLSPAEAIAIAGRSDVVFPAVHGVGGEDGALAAWCELAGVPCVGSPAAAGAIAMDKHLTKLLATSIGLRVAPGELINDGEEDRVRWPGEPVVVKPVSAGSSQGVRLVRHADDLNEAVTAALHHDRRVLVERVITGREIDIAVLRTRRGLFVPPALEIVKDDGIFDYDTKYGGGADLRVPTTLSATQESSLRDAAVLMYDALGCRGLARIDFFLTDDGPVLLEVNTMPGMTEYSQAPRMFAAAGVEYPELLRRIVHEAVR